MFAVPKGNIIWDFDTLGLASPPTVYFLEVVSVSKFEEGPGRVRNSPFAAR